MNMGKLAITAALITLFVIIIAACCPIPVPRESIRWPGCEFKITDKQGQPLADCELTLYFWSYPHRKLEEELVLISDADGKIVIVEETFDETVMPLVMHGDPEYNWSYYVLKEGYVTVAGGIRYADKGEVIPIEITMREGVSRRFDTFTDFELYILTMPRSNDGPIEGPVEIEAVPEEPVEESVEADE